jgi:predicted transcriptional regulator
MPKQHVSDDAFSAMIAGLQSSGMRPGQIAAELAVSRQSVFRWREGITEPNGMAAGKLTDLYRHRVQGVLQQRAPVTSTRFHPGCTPRWGR